MRVFVTGVTGYLGRQISLALHASGMDVVGLARSEPVQSPPYEVRLGDLSDPGIVSGLQDKVPRFEAIVHAAASLDMRSYDAAVSVNNAVATHHMLILAQAWNCRRFVFLSSAALIGPPIRRPADEEHPVCPLTVYHASKYYGEQLVQLCCQKDMVGISLRVTAPVGAHMPQRRMLRLFVERALDGEPLPINGHGTRRQDYVDEADIVHAVVCALESTVPGVYNIGRGRSYSNVEVARACIDATGSSSEIVFTGQPDPEEGITWEFSIAKAQEQLAYRPKRTLEDSIKALVEEIRHTN